MAVSGLDEILFRDAEDHDAASIVELFRAAYNATGAICCISVLDSGEFVDVNDAWVTTTGWPRSHRIASAVRWSGSCRRWTLPS